MTETTEKLTGSWLPVSTAPKDRKPYSMFVVIAMDVILPGTSYTYTTDPHCVWTNDDGTYARWPHSVPPTHWAPLPHYYGPRD